MDVVGDCRRRCAVVGEPVASRSERRVSGPTHRRYRSGVDHGDPRSRRTATMGNRQRGVPRRIGGSRASCAACAAQRRQRLGRHGGEAQRSEDWPHCVPHSTRQWASRHRVARDALSAPRDRTKRFDALAGLISGADERGVVLFRGDSALAWAGVVRPYLEPVREGISVVATPFYLALQVTRQQADSRSVAVALIDAAPPADRLSTPLTQRLKSDLGLRGFSFAPPTDSSGSQEVLRYALLGQRLFDVRAAPLAQGRSRSASRSPCVLAPASRSFSHLRVS